MQTRQPIRYSTPQETADASLELALLAPYNDGVQVLGSFNNWQPQEMVRDEEGWWHLPLAIPDGDYEYRFRVKSKSWFSLDQWVEVSDPRAARVNWQNSFAAVLKVRAGKRIVDEYLWQHDDKPLPPDDDLVLYELHVGGFGVLPGSKPKTGTLQGVLAKLDYIQKLGVNALELMPLHEFTSEFSWGYNPSFHFALETDYGTPSDFKKLVDECHARGIRVILDVVFNHGTSEHPLAQIDHDYWFHHDNPDPEGVRFGPKFNYVHFDEHRGTFPARDYSRECLLFWQREYHLDGFRFDATALINNFDAMREWRDLLKANSGGKPLILIAEHLPADPAVTGLHGPMDTAWHFTFQQQIQANILDTSVGGRKPCDLEGTMQVVDARREGFQGGNDVVNFVSSHDEEYAMMQLGSAGIFDQVAFRRAKHAAAFLLTSPGVPMLRMGEEFGEFKPKSMSDTYLNWDLLSGDLARDLFNYYAALILLRKTNAALQHGNSIEFLYSNDERKILAFKRWDEQGGMVVVVAHLHDVMAGDVEIPNMPADGTWHEWTANYDVTVQGNVLRDQLGESQVKVYIKT